MDVSRDDLYEGDDQDDVKNNALNLFATDGTDDWELFVYRTGGNVTVTNDPATSDECTTGSSKAEIDVRAGEFNGSECDELDLPSALDNDFQIEFQDVQDGSGTEFVNGTYTLVVNGSDAVATNDTYHPDKFNVSGKATPTAPFSITSR